MRKLRKIQTLLLFVLCLCIFTGCGNQLSREAKEYKDQQRLAYESRATELITTSLAEKYGDVVSVSDLKLEELEDYSYGFSAEPYNKTATAKATIGDENKEFDVYIRWDIENNPNNFICCDNREQELIIRDLNEYFFSIYGKEPYAKYYGVFPSLDYDIGKTDGMIREKYNGNIEEYMTQFKGLINIVLVYDNAYDVAIDEEFEEYAVLSNAKNVYIINTDGQTLTEDNLPNIVIRNWISDYEANITEYIRFNNGNVTYWPE